MPDRAGLFKLIQYFNDFSKGNDPYSEHDFGKVEYNGNEAFFKIDYYDVDMVHGSEDPSDPEQTQRVMTIMLTHEY